MTDMTPPPGVVDRVLAWAWRALVKLARFMLPGLVALTVARLLRWVLPDLWWVPAALGLVLAGVVLAIGHQLGQLLARGYRWVGSWTPDLGYLTRRRPLHRPAARRYNAAWLVTAGGLLAALARLPLLSWFTLAAITVSSLGVTIPPWWRRRVRQEGRRGRWAHHLAVAARHVEAIHGSRVLDVRREVAGTFVAELWLRGGRTVPAVVAAADQITSALATRPRAVTITGSDNARVAHIRIQLEDPWLQDLPHPFPQVGTVDIRDRQIIARYSTGEAVKYRLRNLLIVGELGSGKSVLLETLLANAVAARNAAPLGIDLGKATLMPWQPVMAAPVATTPDDAIRLLRAVVAAIEYREGLLAAWKTADPSCPDDIEPTPEMPAIVIYIDEIKTLIREGRTAAIRALEACGERGRKVWIRIINAGHGAGREDVGSTTYRGQLPGTIGMRSSLGVAKTLWGDLRNAGWDSSRIGPDGVLLLHDPDHQVPRLAKGVKLTAKQRAQLIADASKCPTVIDGGTWEAMATVLGDQAPARSGGSSARPDGVEAAFIRACREPGGASTAELLSIAQPFELGEWQAKRLIKRMIKDHRIRRPEVDGRVVRG